MQQTEIDGTGPAEVANDAPAAPEASEAAPGLPRHRSPAAMRLVRRGKTPAGAPAAPRAERAPLPSEEAPAPLVDDEPAPRYIQGIRVPHAAMAYRVARYADGRSKKVVEYCTLTPPGASEAVEYFPLSTPEGGPIPPDWPNVLRLWGSGFYAFQWSGPNREWMGWSERKRLDDARFPPMPAHRRIESLPTAAPAPAAPVAATAMEPMAAIVQSLAASGGGKIDASVAIALMMLVNQMNAGVTAGLEARQRQWRLEDEARAAERDREHERRLERERSFAAEDRQRIETFYTSARAREVASSSDERMARLEERLEEALDLLDEQEPSEPAAKSVTDQAIEALLPVVAGRLGQAMAAPPPTPPEGTKT